MSEKCRTGCIGLFLLPVLLKSAENVEVVGRTAEIVDQLPIEKVWSGHPVGFSLLTVGKRQFAAYYDAERRMTVAGRTLGLRKWTFKKLPTSVGWDSHNSIVMAVDRAGCLHVTGNMHVRPLLYFRSEKPYDITTLAPVHRMTGEDEARVTYPRFFHDDAGRLLFMYRDGSSGNGRRLINFYNEKDRSWRRLIDTPLLSGRSHDMNAYPRSMQKGPKGWYHLVWMWRDTPDCRTNHDISYARSRNLKDWETAAGRPVALPITPAHDAVKVDPTPSRAGMINMGFGLGFDTQSRPIIHYHKYDKQGNSQIYLARWEKKCWRIKPVSSWSWRWEFGGGGSVPCKVGARAVRVLPDGRLIQSWSNSHYGSGTWVLDPETLSVKGAVRCASLYPPEVRKTCSSFPGMHVKWCGDAGAGDTQGDVFYALRWETLSSNRDRPRKGPIPEPVMLTLYTFKR